MKGSNRLPFVSVSAGLPPSGVTKGGRILDRRSGDPDRMARAAQGNRTVILERKTVNWR
jgi:hypothetical protein